MLIIRREKMTFLAIALFWTTLNADPFFYTHFDLGSTKQQGATYSVDTFFFNTGQSLKPGSNGTRFTGRTALGWDWNKNTNNAQIELGYGVYGKEALKPIDSDVIQEVKYRHDAYDATFLLSREFFDKYQLGPLLGIAYVSNQAVLKYHSSDLWYIATNVKRKWRPRYGLHYAYALTSSLAVRASGAYIPGGHVRSFMRDYFSTNLNQALYNTQPDNTSALTSVTLGITYQHR